MPRSAAAHQIWLSFRELGILTCHSSPNTLPQVTDQPNDSGGSSCHILAVWQMRSATASMDVRALSSASPPPCGIGKMNRPLFPHCQIEEKSPRLRGRKMTSVRASLSTSSSHSPGIFACLPGGWHPPNRWLSHQLKKGGSLVFAGVRVWAGQRLDRGVSKGCGIARKMGWCGYACGYGNR
jgi:hypothetical protein